MTLADKFRKSYTVTPRTNLRKLVDNLHCSTRADFGVGFIRDDGTLVFTDHSTVKGARPKWQPDPPEQPKAA